MGDSSILNFIILGAVGYASAKLIGPYFNKGEAVAYDAGRNYDVNKRNFMASGYDANTASVLAYNASYVDTVDGKNHPVRGINTANPNLHASRVSMDVPAHKVTYYESVDANTLVNSGNSSRQDKREKVLSQHDTTVTHPVQSNQIAPSGTVPSQESGSELSVYTAKAEAKGYPVINYFGTYLSKNKSPKEAYELAVADYNRVMNYGVTSGFGTGISLSVG